MDQLPESINNVIVPKLIIQPIVENAFNYGLKNEITQKLHIGIKVIDNIIYISVSDNGSDINEKLFLELNEKVNNKELNIENTALININKRLKLFFGPNYGLSFYKSEYGGLCVEIKIPKEGKNNV
jgi:two-component system sensor histidine kinase YesM